jgi:hypothetical protein
VQGDVGQSLFEIRKEAGCGDRDVVLIWFFGSAADFEGVFDILDMDRVFDVLDMYRLDKGFIGVLPLLGFGYMCRLPTIMPLKNSCRVYLSALILD